jgi:hypothetical protein
MSSESKAIVRTALAGVFCLVFLWVLSLYNQAIVPLRLSSPNAADIGTALLGFLLVSLFVERAVEVFANVWREHEKKPLVAAVQRSAAILEAAKRGLAKPGKETTALVAAAADDHKRAVTALQAYQAETRSQAALAAVLLGGAIALFGIRALDVFVAEHGALGAWQNFLFSATDVLVTAALLGGGADGIHKIISVFTAYADKTKAIAEGTVPPPS